MIDLKSCSRLIAHGLFKASVFILFLFSTTSIVNAQKPPRKIKVPENIEDTRVSILTVGLGEALYMRYGHTLLKVESGDDGRSYMYNWGMFSFNDPAFAYNFYLGQRIYWVGETNQRYVTKLYRDYEDRSVYEQTINLTNLQKSKLIEIINENLTAEKMFFNYEHFSSNCATKPRDFIDKALGGYISRNLSKSILDGTTYRNYVRENMNKPPVIGFILDILMSSDLDKTLTKWDETFYPPKLSEHLSLLAAIDDEGEPIEGKPLLGPKRSLVSTKSDHKSSSFMFIIPFSITFLVIMLVLFREVLLYSTRKKFSRYFFLGIGLLSISWGLFSGLMGFLMLLSWGVSTHLDMHHNVNLFVFFFIDFLFVYSGIKV